jgi:hypothetical protein
MESTVEELKTREVNHLKTIEEYHAYREQTEEKLKYILKFRYTMNILELKVYVSILRTTQIVQQSVAENKPQTSSQQTDQQPNGDF